MCMHPVAIMGMQMAMQMASIRQQTKAQVAMYDQQAKIADYNAKLSERKAEQIADNYAKEQRQLNNKMRLVAGQNRAEAGASNLMMTGTPLQMLGAGIDAYNEDSTTLLQNQRNDVDTQGIQTWNYRNQAAGARASAANAKQSGKMQMIGTLLSTASSISGYYNDYGKVSTGAASNSNLGYYNNPYGFSDNMGKLGLGNNVSSYGYNSFGGGMGKFSTNNYFNNNKRGW